MNAKVARTTTATAALLLAGALTACSDDSEGSAPPPGGEDPAPDVTEPETREEAPSDDLGGGTGEAPSGGAGGEAPSEDGAPGGPPMDDDGVTPPDDGGAPEGGTSEDGTGADEAEGPPGSDPSATTLIHDQMLSVEMPDTWWYAPDTGWAGPDGAAVQVGECLPPDEGPPLGYDECVEFVPNAGQPSASDPTTEVDIQALDLEAEGLRGTEVTVVDGPVAVVYWIVEDQDSGETAVIEYNGSGIDEDLVASVHDMSRP